jgi:putative nucleotidyltransferase with HDIG domain
MRENGEKNGKIVALILAAGFSSRMGELKPLLPLGRSSVIEEAVDRFWRGGIDDVRVVVGHRAEELTPFLDRLRVRWVLNPDYESGMLSSIFAGVRSLEPDVEAFFLLPVDIPLVKPRTISELIERYRETGTAVVYPRFLNEPGHPPLIATACVSDLPPQFEGGMRAYLSRFDARAVYVDVVDQAVVMDCDTPSEYRRLLDYAKRWDIPSVQECEAFWRRFDVSENVIAHSRVVAELARLLAVHLHRVGCSFNIPLIIAAGLLHDLMKGTPDHARAGAKVLRDSGYPEVAAIVASHMDIRLMHLMPSEADLIYLADKCVDGDRVVRLEDRFDKALAKFAGKPEILKAVAGRFKNAKAIRARVENLLRTPFDLILEKHAKNLQMASANGKRRIFLVRHGAIRIDGSGKHYIGQLDLPLSQEGVRQAERLREELRYVPLSAVFCSDLDRSVATARIVAEPHGVYIDARPDLREIALGKWEGLAFDEARRLYGEDVEERGRDIVHFRPPGGESFLDCTFRVIPALYDILRTTRGDILIVGHAGVNRILLCHAMKKPLCDLFDLKQDYGCINVIGYKDFAFEVEAINEMCYLSEMRSEKRGPGLRAVRRGETESA